MLGKASHVNEDERVTTEVQIIPMFVARLSLGKPMSFVRQH